RSGPVSGSPGLAQVHRLIYRVDSQATTTSAGWSRQIAHQPPRRRRGVAPLRPDSRSSAQCRSLTVATVPPGTLPVRAGTGAGLSVGTCRACSPDLPEENAMRYTFWHALLGSFRRKATHTPRDRDRRRSRPALEELEPRVVPTTFTWIGQGADAN